VCGNRAGNAKPINALNPVIKPKANIALTNISILLCRIAIMAAIKKVLSPISLARIMAVEAIKAEIKSEFFDLLISK